MTGAEPADDPVELERELLGGDREFTRTEVAERAGVPIDHARRLWRALGFADLDDHSVAFTERDVKALVEVQGLMERGLIDAQTQLAMTRAMGQSLARLAEWQVAALTQALAEEEGDWTEEGAVGAAHELIPVMEDLIGYVWRRHLAASASRALARPTDSDAAAMAVGFADLVGFTSLTRHVDESELAGLVERFESIAADVVAEHGGRVVKTVGDEVMFSTDTAPAAAEIALSLLERTTAAEELPDLRIGVGYGNVLARLGDVYGEPVNIAARLTTIARPGSILVDRELAAALEGDDRFRLRRVPPRPVRGYTLLHPLRLRRGDEAADTE